MGQGRGDRRGDDFGSKGGLQKAAAEGAEVIGWEGFWGAGGGQSREWASKGKISGEVRRGAEAVGQTCW